MNSLNLGIGTGKRWRSLLGLQGLRLVKSISGIGTKERSKLIHRKQDNWSTPMKYLELSTQELARILQDQFFKSSTLPKISNENGMSS